MLPFWKTVVVPVISCAGARVVADLGLADDEHAQALAEACSAVGAVGHVVDPGHELDRDSLTRRFPDAIRVHSRQPLAATASIGAADVAIVRGDPNWYTVLHLLRSLEEAAAAARRDPPIALVHGVRWPFGRRDGYRDPELVPAEARQPVSREGVVPGRRQLAPDGLETGLWNAVSDHGPGNGVRTAVDDFVDGSTAAWSVVDLPGFGGLAILASKARISSSAGLDDLLTSFRRTDFLEDHCRRLELHRLATEHALQRTQRERLAQIGTDLAAAREEAATHGRELAAAREQTAALAADLDAARSAADERARDLAAADRACAVAEARLDAHLRAAEAMEHELRASRARLESELVARDEQLDELRSERAQLEAQLAAGLRQLEDAEASVREALDTKLALDDAQKNAAALERELESRDTELRAARDQERHLAARLTQLDAAVSEARLDAADAERTLERSAAEIERLQVERERVRLHLERALSSRAWRLGHRTTLALRRLTFRRTVKRSSALDEALKILTVDASSSRPLAGPAAPRELPSGSERHVEAGHG